MPMEQAITTIVFIIIIILLISKANKRNMNKAKAKPKPAQLRAQTTVSPPVKKSPVVNKKITAPELNHNMLSDDRANDWLARQLREEHLAFKKTKDMFNLKIEHASHCDAKYIRDFHHHSCDANQIDTAAGK